MHEGDGAARGSPSEQGSRSRGSSWHPGSRGGEGRGGRSPQEVQQRGLDDAGGRPERGLVGRGLQLQLEDGLRQVDVLDLRLGRAQRDAGVVGLGLEVLDPVGPRPDVGQGARQPVQGPVDRVEVAARSCCPARRSATIGVQARRRGCSRRSRRRPCRRRRRGRWSPRRRAAGRCRRRRRRCPSRRRRPPRRWCRRRRAGRGTGCWPARRGCRGRPPPRRPGPSRPAAPIVVLPPWTVSSRARRRAAEDSCRALSAVVSHDTPFSALRTYWALAARSPRSCMMSLAPMGESDGFSTCLPLDSCSCRREERASEDCRLRVRRVGHRPLRDPEHQRPTSPVRLMSVSRAWSTAVSMRAAPS